MNSRKFKLLLTGAALLGSVFSAQAVPARAEWRTVRQPDGSELVIRNFGDERFHYTLTDDNHLVVADGNGSYCYASVDAQGRFVNSGIMAASASRRSAQATDFLSSLAPAESMIEKAAKIRETSEAFRSPARVPSNMLTSNFPSQGEQPVLVVLVQYTDVKFRNNTDIHSYYTRMLNEEGFSDDGGTGSARDYFLDCSAGRFSPRFDVYGPITLAHDMAYYGGNDSNGNDLRPEEMAIEACKALDSEVDFSIYDTDNDGKIDNVFVIYAGHGEADGSSSPNTVWPHAFWIYSSGSASVILDGKYLDHYACSNELDGNNRPDGIGTTCHEFSHVMGLPDLYTTNYSSQHTPMDWSVLDQGCYNNDGRTPPLYSSFERLSLGWIDPVEIKSASQVMAPNLADNVAFLVSTTDNNEFFLFENRQKSGWDQYLKGHGMLVWHITYDSYYWNSNAVNNYALQRVDLVEAGGPKSLFGYPLSSGSDSWPGTSNRKTFGPTSSPAFTTNAGKTTGFTLTNITETDGLVTFSVNDGTSRISAPAAPEATDITGRTATISWAAVEGATDYLLTVWAENEVRPLMNHVHTAGATSRQLTDLKPETTYHVSVMAIGNSCVSDESALKTFSTSAPLFTESKVEIADPTEMGTNTFTANWQPLNEAESYILSVNNFCPSTEFDVTAGYDGSTLPEGWSTNSTAKYVGIPGSFGQASPAIRFNKLGDYVQTAVMDGEVNYLSFWLRGRSANAALNFMTVQGLNASEAWEKITDVAISQTARTVELVIPAGYRAIKIEYTGQQTSTIPVGIDDICIRGGAPEANLPVITELNVGNVTSYKVTVPESRYNTYEYFVKAVKGEEQSLVSDVKTLELQGNSGIGSIVDDAENVSIRGGEFITIEGTDADARVYNLQGNIVYDGPRRTIALPAGLYIVKVGTKTAKILVR